MRASESKVHRNYLVRGRVQGVGFRYFVQHTATAMGVTGWVRNLDDGRVEVHASGTADQLRELEGFLWKGPRFSDVRGVEVTEAAPESLREFRIR